MNSRTRDLNTSNMFLRDIPYRTSQIEDMPFGKHNTYKKVNSKKAFHWCTIFLGLSSFYVDYLGLQNHL